MANIWLADFKMFLAASNITNKTKQRALLLYQVGSRVRKVFRQFPVSGTEDDIGKVDRGTSYGVFRATKESFIRSI